MRHLLTVVTLALVCGVCRPEDEPHRSKHFETLYSWTGIDYMFPDEEMHSKSLQDGSFVPGNAVPWGLEIDMERNRMFISTTKFRPGIPVSLSTISNTKNHKGEHFAQPYPDYSWHNKGCEGIISAAKLTIDECDRLWVMDSGTLYPDGFLRPLTQVCPPQILVFDLKTDQLIRRHRLNASMYDAESYLTTIVVEILSTENKCNHTFTYVADPGDFQMVVYDFANDDSWLVIANEMYPYPEYGRFNITGVTYDLMYGIFSMTMTPKKAGEEDRTLYFNSVTSAKMSYVKTSVLKKKENFVLYNHVSSAFSTFPETRVSGASGSDIMTDDGVIFYGSYSQLKLYCWNHHKDYTRDNMAEVDRDDIAFQMFAEMKIVKLDGVSYLYVLTNSFHKFLFQNPGEDEVVFRVMRAPVDTLIQGTVCI